MFRIKSVEIQGFKSFAEPQRFEFPTKAGLYYVQGVNEYRPRLGPNGVGKSTLIDAIFWCLYGRTPRGLKAGDIITWGKKHASVEVTLDVNGVDTVVTRTQAPNSLVLMQDSKGRPVDQEAVDKALRLNAEAFEVSVIRPQFGDSFLKMKPGEKLTLFSQIMGLDFWLEKSKTAAELAKELEREIQTEERKIATYKGLIDLLDHDLGELKSQERDYEGKVKLQIQEQQALIKKAEAEISKINAAIDEHDPDLQEALTETVTKHSKVEAELNNATLNIRDFERKRDRLPKEGATCSECQQLVTKGHLKVEKEFISNEIFRLKDRISTLNIKLHSLNEEKLETLRAIREVNDLNQDKSRYKGGITIAKGKIDDLKSATNPYREMITKKGVEKLEKEQKLTDAKKALKEISEQHVGVSYWINGFKKLRLFIIEQTLKQLEIEINNNLASLGMPEWSITLDVERENKSGGVTKGFVVFVHSPDSKQPVRFEAWSGGETQRLCLAGDMGLANLILERAGLVSHIEFYDETSKGLSVEGQQDLAETLAQRAENEDKVILLIDHTIIDFGGFAGTIKVVKDAQGSHLMLG